MEGKCGTAPNLTSPKLTSSGARKYGSKNGTTLPTKHGSGVKMELPEWSTSKNGVCGSRQGAKAAFEGARKLPKCPGPPDGKGENGAE